MRCLVSFLALALVLATPLSAPDTSGGLAQLPEAAQDDHALALALVDRSDPEGALAPAERALAVSTDLLGPMNGTTIFLALQYGAVLDQLGREDEALARYEPLYQGVLQTYSEWSPYHAMVTIAYADILSKLGRNAEALPLALRDAAQVLRRMGHLDEALEAYRRILPIFDAAGGPDDAVAAAGVAFLIADVLDRQNRLEEAAAAYAEADARAATVRGPDHPESIAVRLGRARLALALGD
jgi:tetratricopeptide (TPR) repeat protein